jgi:hypothetical protein
VLLATGTGEIAIPLALVATAVVADPLNSALAPLPGAVNVTVAPLTRFPNPSLTVTCRAAAKAVFTGVLWGVPLVATRLAGAPAVLVRLKLAGVATPAALAVTV